MRHSGTGSTATGQGGTAWAASSAPLLGGLREAPAHSARYRAGVGASTFLGARLCSAPFIAHHFGASREGGKRLAGACSADFSSSRGSLQSKLCDCTSGLWFIKAAENSALCKLSAGLVHRHESCLCI